MKVHVPKLKTKMFQPLSVACVARDPISHLAGGSSGGSCRSRASCPDFGASDTGPLPKRCHLPGKRLSATNTSAAQIGG